MSNYFNSYNNHGGREQRGCEYTRRPKEDLQPRNHPPNSKTMETLERIRECKPVLLKRLRAIKQSNLARLQDTAKNIERWIEIAGNNKAHLMYKLEELEESHEKILELIRLDPLEDLQQHSSRNLDDDDEDEAPRSPSPVEESNMPSTRIIPLESFDNAVRRETDRRGQGYGSSADYRSNSNERSNHWAPASTPTIIPFNNRGDTDMRVPPQQSFSRYNPYEPPERIPRNRPEPEVERIPRYRPGDERAEPQQRTASNSIWNNPSSSRTWERGRRQSGESRPDDNRRSRPSDPVIDRTNNGFLNNSHRGDPPRNFGRDRDYRDSSRGPEPDSNRESGNRSGSAVPDNERHRYNNRDYMRIREKSHDTNRPRDNADSRDRNDSSNSYDRRGYDRRLENRSHWNVPSSPAVQDQTLASPRYGSFSPSPSTSSPNPFATVNGATSDSARVNSMPPASPQPFPSQPSFMPRAPNNFGSPFANNSPSSRPGLMPNPFLSGATCSPYPSSPAVYDQPPRKELTLEDFKAKAQQHFARQRQPRPPNPTNMTRPLVPPPPPIISTTAANPNLATNQIAAELPTDPRRLNQIKRMQEKHQQEQAEKLRLEEEKRKREEEAMKAKLHPVPSESLPDPRGRRVSETGIETSDVSPLSDPRRRRTSGIGSSDSPSSPLPDPRKSRSSNVPIVSRQTESVGATTKKNNHDLSERRPSSNSTEESGDELHLAIDESGHDSSDDTTRSESPERKRSKLTEVTSSPRRSSRIATASTPTENEKRALRSSAKSSDPEKSEETATISTKEKTETEPSEQPAREGTRVEPVNMDTTIVTTNPAGATPVSLETVSKSEEPAAGPSAAKSDSSAGADDLLLQLMRKLFPEKQELISDTSMLSSVKRLLQDQVQALAEHGATEEADHDDHEVDSHTASETTGTGEPGRGRPAQRKRGGKRRSSLERLHDALKEMNFEKIMPTGPRRTSLSAHSDGEGAPPDSTTSLAMCIEEVVDNAMKQNETSPDVTSSTTTVVKAKRAVVKRGRPAGSGRKRKKAWGVGRGRKKRKPTDVALPTANADVVSKEIREHLDLDVAQMYIGPVTAEAAQRAASAVPIDLFTALKATENVQETSTNEPSNPSPQIQRKGMKNKSASSEAKAPERVTRSRAKPSASVTSTSSESGSAVDTASPSKQSDTSLTPQVSPTKEELPKCSSESSTETTRKEIENVIATPSEPEEVISVEKNPGIFLMDTYNETKTHELIQQHERLLTDKIFCKKNTDPLCTPTLNNLAKLLSVEIPPVSYDHEFTEDEIPQECVDAVNWVVGIIECRLDSSTSAGGGDSPHTNNSAEVDFVKLGGKVVKEVELDLEVYEEDENEIDTSEFIEHLDVKPLDEEEVDIKPVIPSASHTSIASTGSSLVSERPRRSSLTSAGLSRSNSNSGFEDMDEASFDGFSLDGDADPSKKTNLDGHELYRCANQDCKFTAASASTFKEHLLSCSSAPENRLYQCTHCERRMKSVQSLMEHLKIHGRPKLLCSLCNFTAGFSSEISKHMKGYHRVYHFKPVSEIRQDEDPVQVVYAKAVSTRLAQPRELTENHRIYTSKIRYRPTEIEHIPRDCVFNSLAHCSVCDYSTKVRTNIVRHLTLHLLADDDSKEISVPEKAPVNPVPCLERKEMMFDKMTNLAGSSHGAKLGGVSKEDTLKLPQFVPEAARYKCSLRSCKKILCSESILETHLKTSHSKEKFYACPHCQEQEETRKDPRNSVPIDNISDHLKMHGPKLYRCGHCDYASVLSSTVEVHLNQKHVEKKQIFYVIRNLDNDGNSMTRRSSVDDSSKPSFEKWSCTLCKTVSGGWLEAKSHCLESHRVQNQFMCSICQFGTDNIYIMSNHIMNRQCLSNVSEKIQIMFYRNENDGADAKKDDDNTIPIWRRDAFKLKHIRGIYFEDESMKKAVVASGSGSATKVGAKSTPPAAPSSSSATITKASASPLELVCPKCNTYTTKSPVDLKDHLFTELGYLRFICPICSLKTATVELMKNHLRTAHKSLEMPMSVLPKNDDLETQVHETISKMVSSQKQAHEKDPRASEDLLCKHCFIHITSYHNYKTHVLAKHIGQDRFKCNVCKLGFWNEAVLKVHHSKSSHAHIPLVIIRNEDLERTLTPEFWLKEYGVPLNKSPATGSPSPQKATASKNILADESSGAQVGTNLSNGSNECRNLLPQLQQQDATQKRAAPKVKQPPQAPLAMHLNTVPDKTARLAKITALLKNFRELTFIFRCEFCSLTCSNLKALRHHWMRDHLHKEKQCRYYKCPGYDDNFNLNDGYALKCNMCEYQSVSLENFCAHHHSLHQGMPAKSKRKKRWEQVKNSKSWTQMFTCSRCFCECETEAAIQLHYTKRHPNVYCAFTNIPVPENDGVTKFKGIRIVEDVSADCTICHSEYGDAPAYLEHFKAEHYNDGLEAAPDVKFRAASEEPEKEYDLPLANSLGMNINANVVQQQERLTPSSSSVRQYPSFPKKTQLKTTTSATASQPSATSSRRSSVAPGENPVTYVYACPQCEMRSDDENYMMNVHMMTHILFYHCPECSLGFTHSLDAHFHIRHYHGSPSSRPMYNNNAYNELIDLKGRVTKSLFVPAPPPEVLELSDDDCPSLAADLGSSQLIDLASMGILDFDVLQ